MYNYLNSDRDFYPKSTTDSTISYSYSPSDELILFDNSAMKIAMLLIMSEKVENLNFQITEKELFEELGQIGFVDVNIEIQKMRRNGKEILLQQTIIAIVSSWEVYFSSIIKKIFEADQQPLKDLEGLSFPNQFHNFIYQNYSVNDYCFLKNIYYASYTFHYEIPTLRSITNKIRKSQLQKNFRGRLRCSFAK